MTDTTATTTPAPVSAHASEAETKATAKNATDAIVAADPNAKHGVIYSVKSPKVWASAAAGAAIGAPLGPPGMAIGAVVGGLVQRHNVLGGPVGKALDWAKGKIKGTKKP